MARPERNNVDYFPFYCEDGKKMFYLEETYGNDGFATFIKLLRELAKTDFHYLDLSKNTTTMFLSAKCKISKETLESIIDDLVELDKFDSVLWNENRIVWCQDFTDSIQDAYTRRNNKCITYDGLLLHLCSLGIRKPIKRKGKGGKNPQTILKDIKVNQTDVDLIYYLYPTTCKVQNRPTAKGAKDKEKIKILLKEISLKDLSATITGYIENSKLSKSYIQNFSTFLNNLPDLQELRETWLILSENNPDKEETAAEKLIRKKKRADLF